MNSQQRAMLQIVVLIGVVLALVMVFPRAYAFAEIAARELRYLWWLILFIALGIWLVWGLGRKPRQ